MELFIPSKEELDDAIYKAVKKAMQEEMPELIHKATRKKWLRTEEVMEIIQCSRRHVQYLRDSNQLDNSNFTNMQELFDIPGKLWKIF